MPNFRIVSDFKPTGDQPDAIAKLVDGMRRYLKDEQENCLASSTLRLEP